MVRRGFPLLNQWPQDWKKNAIPDLAEIGQDKTQLASLFGIEIDPNVFQIQREAESLSAQETAPR
jgi:hypothetical protein